MANRKKNIEFNEEDDKESASERRARIIDVIERSHTFLTLRNTEELLYFDPPRWTMA
jgi:site-specific DNA-adenine methylase